MKTVIKPCKCEHKFQDQRYGIGNRVHNINKDGTKGKCTVCKDIKYIVK